MVQHTAAYPDVSPPTHTHTQWPAGLPTASWWACSTPSRKAQKHVVIFFLIMSPGALHCGLPCLRQPHTTSVFYGPTADVARTRAKVRERRDSAYCGSRTASRAASNSAGVPRAYVDTRWRTKASTASLVEGTLRVRKKRDGGEI